MNSTTPFWLVFLLLSIFQACKGPILLQVDERSQPVADVQEEPDSLLSDMITEYRVQLEEEMNTVIGTVAQSLTLQKPESSLGNWMADVLWEKATFHSKQPVDFALQNYGGIRISELPAGPLTRGKIYELMPFDNQLVVLDLPGTIVDSLLQHIGRDGVWPCSRSLKMELADRLVQNVELNGAPLSPTATYRVAMPDFIADGGSRCFFLTSYPREELGVMIRDLLIDYVMEQERSQRPIQAQIDGRVKVVDP